MIDPSIITRGAERAQMQQQQNFESLGELGNSIGRMVLGRRINTLQQLTTPEEKQAYANKSIYAPQLNAQIKADEATALQAQMVQQKHAADIGNTNAQAAERNSNVGKNIQQGVGYSLDNSGKLLAAFLSCLRGSEHGWWCDSDWLCFLSCLRGSEQNDSIFLSCSGFLSCLRGSELKPPSTIQVPSFSKLPTWQ